MFIYFIIFFVVIHKWRKNKKRNQLIIYNDIFLSILNEAAVALEIYIYKSDRHRPNQFDMQCSMASVQMRRRTIECHTEWSYAGISVRMPQTWMMIHIFRKIWRWSWFALAIAAHTWNILCEMTKCNGYPKTKIFFHPDTQSFIILSLHNPPSKVSHIPSFFFSRKPFWTIFLQIVVCELFCSFCLSAESMRAIRHSFTFHLSTWCACVKSLTAQWKRWSDILFAHSYPISIWLRTVVTWKAIYWWDLWYNHFVHAEKKMGWMLVVECCAHTILW